MGESMRQNQREYSEDELEATNNGTNRELLAPGDSMASVMLPSSDGTTNAGFATNDTQKKRGSNDKKSREMNAAACDVPEPPEAAAATTTPGAYAVGGASERNVHTLTAERSLTSIVTSLNYATVSPPQPAAEAQRQPTARALVRDEEEAVVDNLITAELVVEEEDSTPAPTSEQHLDELEKYRQMPTAVASHFKRTCVDDAFDFLCYFLPAGWKEKSSKLKGLVLVARLAILAGAVVAIAVPLSSSSESSSGSNSNNNPSAGTALVMIDVEDCFLEASVSSTGEAGSLTVRHAAGLIPVINEVREKRGCLFDLVVRSQDFHPWFHISFASTHGLPPFAHTLGKGGLPITCFDSSTASFCPTYWLDPDSQDCDEVLCPNATAMTQEAMEHVLDSPACIICKESSDRCFTTQQFMWPDHCVQNVESGFPPSLDTERSDIVLQKGDNDCVDAYSAFLDNTRQIKTPLDSILKSSNVDTVYVMRIATDFGVLFSASHAKFLGYRVNVVLDATRSIADDTEKAAIERMQQEGITILNSTDLLDSECP